MRLSPALLLLLLALGCSPTETEPAPAPETTPAAGQSETQELPKDVFDKDTPTQTP